MPAPLTPASATSAATPASDTEFGFPFSTSFSESFITLKHFSAVSIGISIAYLLAV